MCTLELDNETATQDVEHKNSFSFHKTRVICIHFGY